MLAYTTDYGLTKSTVKNMMSDRVMPARPPRNKTIKQPSALPVARQTSPTDSTKNKIKIKPPERAHSVPCRGSDHPFQRKERAGCDCQTHMIPANVHPLPPNNALHPNAAQQPVKG